ncbi:Protein of unknown function [Gryllus bimaculatus]|nr:Protein of unknown function [Gryllus bimaculatus]
MFKTRVFFLCAIYWIIRVLIPYLHVNILVVFKRKRRKIQRKDNLKRIVLRCDELSHMNRVVVDGSSHQWYLASLLVHVKHSGPPHDVSTLEEFYNSPFSGMWKLFLQSGRIGTSLSPARRG